MHDVTDADAADDEPDDDGADDSDGDVRVGTAVYLPSLAEIAAACEEFRRGWLDEERERRWTGPGRVEWSVPGVDRYHSRTDRDAFRSFLGSGAAAPDGNVWGHQHRDGCEPPAGDASRPMPFDD